MYRHPASPNVALAYFLRGDMPPGGAPVLDLCSRSIAASLLIILWPSGVAYLGQMGTQRHRYAFPWGWLASFSLFVGILLDIAPGTAHGFTQLT